MITPEEVFDVLEEDVGVADMILWVGISFQQSASTAYFRRVRHFLQVCTYFPSFPAHNSPSNAQVHLVPCDCKEAADSLAWCIILRLLTPKSKGVAYARFCKLLLYTAVPQLYQAWFVD